MGVGAYACQQGSSDPGSGITGNCKLKDTGSGNQNGGPLEEQEVPFSPGPLLILSMTNGAEGSKEWESKGWLRRGLLY